MKALYVGTLTNGSTSRMRAEKLRDLDPDIEWRWINTDAIMRSFSRAWQSAAFRLQSGNVVTAINSAVLDYIRNEKFDLAWIDKAIFLTPPTVRALRNAARSLIHYTPDTAFHLARSRHFEKTVSLYDLLVTTKSFDVREYIRLAGRDTVHLTTQGFDPAVHYPRNGHDERKKAVVFVGLAEPERERCLETLLSYGIDVQLAGIGWGGFVKRMNKTGHLFFHARSVFDDKYAQLLSKAWVGLGLLSKRFPELHTTRTFEIPACGAVLATEATEETSGFFSPGEALFYSDYDDLAVQIQKLFEPGREQTLKDLANSGYSRVTGDDRSYVTILRRVLADPRIQFTKL